ncbi:MAG: serine/threonine-protein kinase [Nocardioides sp.]
MTATPRPQTRQVGDYTLLARLGEGGMGVVHLARKPDGHRVALKVLRPHIVGDDEARARLAREVGSLSRIRSQWVAEIVDADPWGEVPYVATRYVPGLSLHDQVQESGPIKGADLTWFARCLAEGIISVHRVGVLHRDVKPSNVLMEGRTPILIDFGLARVADDPKLTHTGWLLGTPGYLAPEILYGDDATAASDVHSWAATVAYAGTGRPPFGRGPAIAIMDRVRRGEHDLSGLPPQVAGILGAALGPEPAGRPTLQQIVTWLDPDRVEQTDAPATVRTPLADDVFTMPLALAAQAGIVAPTELGDLDAVTTRSDSWSGTTPWDAPTPEQPRRSAAVRRGVLLAGLALLAGTAIAAVPIPAALLVLALAWVLRSGSALATATGDRQRLRGGSRWYDVVVAPLSAPWHLVAALPGSLLLALWSIGIALAAALLCYAVSATVSVGLLVSGTTLAVSLWLGPGGDRVRSPLRRITQPLSASGRRWIVTLVLLTGLVGLVGNLAAHHTTWTPLRQQPFSHH